MEMSWSSWNEGCYILSLCVRQLAEFEPRPSSTPRFCHKSQFRSLRLFRKSMENIAGSGGTGAPPTSHSGGHASDATGNFPANALPSATPSKSPAGSEITGRTGAASNAGTASRKDPVKSACSNCKKHHLACDEGRPCGRCKLRGLADTCVDSVKAKRGRPKGRKDSPNTKRTKKDSQSTSGALPSPDTLPPGPVAGPMPVNVVRGLITRDLSGSGGDTQGGSDARVQSSPARGSPLTGPPALPGQPPRGNLPPRGPPQVATLAPDATPSAVSNADDAFNLNIDDILGIIMKGIPTTGPLAEMLQKGGERRQKNSDLSKLLEHGTVRDQMESSAKAMHNSISDRRIEVVRYFSALAECLRGTEDAQKNLTWLSGLARGFWEMAMPRFIARSVSGDTTYETDKYMLESYTQTFKEIDLPTAVLIQFDYIRSVNIALCELVGRTRNYFLNNQVRGFELLTMDCVVPYIAQNFHVMRGEAGGGRVSHRMRVKVTNKGTEKGYVECICVVTFVRGVVGMAGAILTLTPLESY